MRGCSPYPDLDKLRRALILRGWTRPDLAEHAGISLGAAYKVVAGKPIAPETAEKVSLALLQHPPSTATAAFLGSSVA